MTWAKAAAAVANRQRDYFVEAIKSLQRETTMDYADAINRLNDEIASVVSRAEARGLTEREIIEELRRIALDLEKEAEV